MSILDELEVEKLAIELLEGEGYTFLSPDDQSDEREDLSAVVLKGRLEAAIDRLNPGIPADTKRYAMGEVLNLSSQDLTENNEAFHRMLTEGVGVEYQKDGTTVGGSVQLVDFDDPLSNDFLVCNQFTVQGKDSRKRPDVVLFTNGLPLVVMELKNPASHDATLANAFNQLNNYKDFIPNLFSYNSLLVISDGTDAKAGSLTAGITRFMAWKTIDGEIETESSEPQMKTLIKGMLRPDILLDLIKQFTVFEKERDGDAETNSPGASTGIKTQKKIAAYHQYHAVNKAVKSTIRAAAEMKEGTGNAKEGEQELGGQELGDCRAGVVWHTQGSGKSLSMVFYAGKLIVDAAMRNPTIVVITDRNDLDDQLFETFAASKQLLRQDPVQAESRTDLKKLLKTSGGGIVFTTIQKFSPEDMAENFELLSDRKNIVVIADEAHRSHYGFGAKTHIKDDEAITKYGFAKYLRDALPSASFIGFSGTPIEKADASTPAVFGNYIDVYDILQAVDDGATVPIYYESRLVKVHLKEEQRESLDDEMELLTEGEETTATEKAKRKWAQIEAIVGNSNRLEIVAADIVEHFEQRCETFEGKAMIVAMSRRIAVELYDEIIKLRPEWDSPNKDKGAIKVVMTSSSSDDKSWQKHSTTKQQRRVLGDRFKNPTDSLKLVIVRDMWLTGFDVPCLHTMYIDKPMKSHNLMQGIARVNRVYKDKPGGRIVDYIGIAYDLKHALANYTDSGGRGKPALDHQDAIAQMLEKYEVVSQMFRESEKDFDYQQYFSTGTQEKLEIILNAQDYILSLVDGRERFIKEVVLLSKTFALSVPSTPALEIKNELGFFQAVKARLIKLETMENGKSSAEIDTAIRQLVDDAISADEVINIFDEAGIKNPDISILSEEFLEEIKGMERKNLALELLKKILNDEITARSKRNFILGKKFSEMLATTINKYRNNLLEAAEVMEELVALGKVLLEAKKRGEDMGLSEEEGAFYDALIDNESAREEMKDETLQELARILVERVRSNVSLDWTIRESARAKLRIIVKKLLNEYGYPPDKQKLATENVLKQAGLFADDWVSQ